MWTHRVKNDEVLHIFNDESNILYILKERKSNLIGNYLVETAV